MTAPLPSHPVTIAVLTDIHYGDVGPIARRRSEIADTLLLRAVHRLNRLIKPDVTVALGDLLDDGAADAAGERLAELRVILDKLTSPSIVLPGNHDGTVDAFYEVFDRPAEIVDLAGVRFLSFIDPEAPGYNATRRASDLARFRQARTSAYAGPIVALQHVCLTPPGSTAAPYNYTNAPNIIVAMADAGVALSIGGHHHDGAPLVRNETTAFVTAPALCEAPFYISVITLAPDGVTQDHHPLAMPAELGLIDRHIHTQFAYCSQNMDVDRAIGLADDFGLAEIGFSEHSGHFYFTRDRYWGGDWGPTGLAIARPADDRMDQYRALRARAGSETVHFGLEVDIDFAGNLLMKPDDRDHIDHLIGSVHRTPSSALPVPELETLADEFMGLTSKLIASDIDILTHPFRIFHLAKRTAPQALYHTVAALLREHGVAAELNFHINQPPPDFFRICLDAGVKLAFGSDAHNLYEIGDFALHLQLLKDIGFDGDLSDILAPGALSL